MTAPLTSFSLCEAARRIRTGDLSPTELVEAALLTIARVDLELGAFATVTAEAARERAALLTREVLRGELRGPLHGIPIAIKDIVETAGVPTKASSRVLANHVPDRDAPVVTRLIDAGAVMVGKTELHEFAMGPTCPHVRNACDPGRIAGGSSGGSAVAVAAGMALGAVGTDTTGSLRIPSAFNGTVSLKPTFGTVPTTGVIPLSWSLDTVGPMAGCVLDTAVLLDSMAASDPRRARPSQPWVRPIGLDGFTIGVIDSLYGSVQEDVAALFSRAVQRLRDLGATTVEVEITGLEFALPASLAIVLSEAASYHERHEGYRSNLYGSDVRALIDLGNFYSARQYVDAQRARAQLKDATSACFEKHRLDAIVTPTLAMTATEPTQTAVEFMDGPGDLFASLVGTSAPASLTGQPTLALPIGVDRHELPAAMSVMGRPFEEGTTIAIGAAYEGPKTIQGEEEAE